MVIPGAARLAQVDTVPRKLRSVLVEVGEGVLICKSSKLVGVCYDHSESVREEHEIVQANF